jgi:hypothetical protein
LSQINAAEKPQSIQEQVVVEVVKQVEQAVQVELPVKGRKHLAHLQTAASLVENALQQGTLAAHAHALPRNQPPFHNPLSRPVRLGADEEQRRTGQGLLLLAEVVLRVFQDHAYEAWNDFDVLNVGFPAYLGVEEPQFVAARVDHSSAIDVLVVVGHEKKLVFLQLPEEMVKHYGI